MPQDENLPKPKSAPPPPEDSPEGRRKAYAYVQKRLAKGRSPEEVRNQFVAAGYPADEAKALVARAEKAALVEDVMSNADDEQGRRATRAAAALARDSMAPRPATSLGVVVGGVTMLAGLVLAGIGGAISYASYVSVSEGGPGLFTWGLIVAGGALFLRGGYRIRNTLKGSD